MLHVGVLASREATFFQSYTLLVEIDVLYIQLWTRLCTRLFSDSFHACRVSDFQAEAIARQLVDVVLLTQGPVVAWLPASPLSASSGVVSKLGPTIERNLDAIFKQGFQDFLTDSSLGKGFSATFLQGVPYFHAPSEVRARMAEALTLVEVTAGHPLDRTFVEDRFYDAKEACLLHKGLVVHSHMPVELTASVWRFLSAKSLLHRTQDHPRLMLFQDIYVGADTPSNPPGDDGGGCGEFGSRERRALAVVGFGEDLLCMLLKPATENARAEQLAESPELDAMVSALLALRQEEVMAKVDSAMSAARMHQPTPPGASVRSPPGSPKRALPAPQRKDTASSAGAVTGPHPPQLHHFVAFHSSSGFLSLPLPVEGDWGGAAQSAHRKELEADFFAACAMIRSTLLRTKRAAVRPPGGGSLETPQEQRGGGEVSGPTSPKGGASSRAYISSIIRGGGRTLGGTFRGGSHSMQDRDSGSSQRVGEGDENLGQNHWAEFGGLAQPWEMSVQLNLPHPPRGGGRPGSPGKSAPGWKRGYWVSGRVEENGQEVYVCQYTSTPLPAVEGLFRLGFGVCG